MFFEFQNFFEAEQKHHLYDKRKDRPKIKETLSLARLFGLDRAQRHPAIPFVYFATILPPLRSLQPSIFRCEKSEFQGGFRLSQAFELHFFFPHIFLPESGDSSFYTCHWRCFGTARCRLKRRSLWRSHRCGFRSLLRFFCDTKSGEAVDGG